MSERLTDNEWIVMRAVWASGRVTVRVVLDAVEADTGWAYSTVKTMMTRLVEKGFLSARREGAATVFEPLVTQRDARRRALGDFLDRAFDGTLGGLVEHLVGERRLNRKDREALRRLIEDEVRRGSSKDER